MTQALAVRKMLPRLGHELIGVVIGRQSDRAVPEYVTQGLGAPIIDLPSPGFALRQSKGVDVPKTVWRALTHHREWRESADRLRALVLDAHADLVINFFEPLTGIMQLRRPLPIPVVSIAHQHMIGHPAHREPLFAAADEVTLKWFAELVGYGSSKLALSLYPAPDMPERHVTVGPPLLRPELFELVSVPGDYYLVYLLNHGYRDAVELWQRRHPQVALHCFYDRPGAAVVDCVRPSLTFHRLSGEKFLRYMAGSRGVVCTAGFESVSEAAWLGKPLLVVPVEHHVEQRWNARDAVQAGLAITDTRFNLDRLLSLPTRADNQRFRQWVAGAEDVLRRALDAGLSGHASDAPPADLDRPRYAPRAG